MAEFKQLALEFVLADDELRLVSNAQAAATAIQAAPASANPVARWVESVQPWMPVVDEGDVAEGEEANTNWTARAKALEFLSRTLDFLPGDVLKSSQVQLLVGFFSAMFGIDHKAGILASASALSRIVAMKSFDSRSGLEIIQSVCALKDDFPRQLPKTRLAVYDLLRTLITHSEVARELQKTEAPALAFMQDMLRLCSSERDPDCLMVWFDTLHHVLVHYDGSEELWEDIFGTFKSYFPISLPRTAQSGLTPEELKEQLRKCFSANHSLAKVVFPFLLGKMERGDGVTVNVKIDILRTIQACIREYQQPAASIELYVSQIWDTLKYEVRNSDVEDTIWATLEVFKTLARRLKGDALRDYALTVTRDCVNDLSTPVYTFPAGRLLVSVLSASTNAFVLVAPSTITHIKDNLRHPKSQLHSQDLLKVLYIVLETRVLLAGSQMTQQDANDFNSIDLVVSSLYSEVYKSRLAVDSALDASPEDIKIATQAVQGVGALICQQPIKPVFVPIDLAGGQPELHSTQSTYSQICVTLMGLAAPTAEKTSRQAGADELVNEALKALQRAVKVCPATFPSLVDSSLAAMRTAYSNSAGGAAEVAQTYGTLLAFVGCSELPSPPVEGLKQYLYLACAMTSELFQAIDARADSNVLCAIAAGIQAAGRYFKDACHCQNVESDEAFDCDDWPLGIIRRYPILATLDKSQLPTEAVAANTDSLTSTKAPTPNLGKDFLLASLFITRCLYRSVSSLALRDTRNTTVHEIVLCEKLRGMDGTRRLQLLYLLSGFAGIAVCEMSDGQQQDLNLEESAVTLFHNDSRSSGNGSNLWSLIGVGQVNMLFLGLLEALRPNTAARLFERGVTQELIHAIITSAATSEQFDGVLRPVTLTILAVLANKCNIESSDTMMTSIEECLASSLQATECNAVQSLYQATVILAIASGLFRRLGSKQADTLLSLLREVPKQPVIGHQLAHRLEMIVAPQVSLTKSKYAIVKPLWMQRTYTALVSPMLQAATGPDAAAQDPWERNNFSVAVMSMVKHMDFPVYETDADLILRISISSAQNIGRGLDMRAALQVMKTIMSQAPETAKDHLRSITRICVDSFAVRSGASPPQASSEPLLADSAVDADDAEVQMACAKLALEIAGELPRMYESRYVVPLASQMQRELTTACGHTMRDVRRSARLARMAWADVR